MSSISVAEGDVFASDGKFRRVVTIFRGVICYEVGSEKNRFCKESTFNRWVKATEAAKINKLAS